MAGTRRANLAYVMSCLPTPTDWNPGTIGQGPSIPASGSHFEDGEFLLHAFRSFSVAAASLETSYVQLRTEVERLQLELEEKNRDLTRSLEETRDVRAHLDLILDGLPCGVLVADCNGEILRSNPEALRLTGEHPACNSLTSLPARLQALLECARQQGCEQETRVCDENGLPRWLAARHALVTGSRNDSVFILRDISERKRMEQARERARREQALAEVSAILAHEIRNPLGSLELFAELLGESKLEDEAHTWVEHLRAGLRTLAATVNNVLHFHSLPEPQRSPVDIGQLLRWAQGFFAPLARQSGLLLSLQTPVEGTCLNADKHRLEQVLLNLVLNAVRVTPHRGWIELGAHKDAETVSLTVMDCGPGIAPEHLSSIFDPGFSTRAGSPGLGLAVCRKIAEQHGGSISAENRSHGGAKFTVTIPSLLSPNGDVRE